MFNLVIYVMAQEHQYAMPVIKRNASGTWVTRLDIPVEAGGKERQLRLHAKTRAALNAKIASHFADVEQYGPPPRETTTVSELLDRWLEKKSHEVEFRTIEEISRPSPPLS